MKKLICVIIILATMMFLAYSCAAGEKPGANIPDMTSEEPTEASIASTAAPPTTVPPTTVPPTTVPPTTVPPTTVPPTPKNPETVPEAIEYIIQRIKNGTYKDAWIDVLFISTDSNSEELNTLISYADALSYNDEKNYVLRNFKIEEYISPNYSGRLAKEIKTFCLQFADIEYDKYARFENGQFIAGDVYKISESKTKAEMDARPYPKIGMTKAEAYNSSWGSPDDTNTTTTAYGSSELWVYKGENYKNRYLYFQDGILTAIQN